MRQTDSTHSVPSISDGIVQAEAQNLQAQAHVHAHVQAEAQAQAQHLAVQAQAHAQAQAEASNHASHLKQMSSLGECCDCDQGTGLALCTSPSQSMLSNPDQGLTCSHAVYGCAKPTACRPLLAGHCLQAVAILLWLKVHLQLCCAASSMAEVPPSGSGLQRHALVHV